MNTIITIIGSSAFIGILTLILNWAQNRKNNSLNYITEERKVWREKIREIAAGIEKCKYQGKNEKNIKQYLNQLEMNINPYGRTFQVDYAKDGHVWKTIEEIRKSDSENRFKKNKKLLLGYLSLMLKEDWERSKGEVRGYSNIMIYAGVESIVVILYTLIYIYVLKLESVAALLGVQFLNVFTLFFMKFFCVDEVNYLVRNSNRGRIKDFLKREKKKKRIIISYVVFIMACFFVNAIMIEKIYPNMIVKQIQYSYDDEKIFIYTKLDTNIWTGLEADIEKSAEKDVIIKDIKDIPDDTNKSIEFDKILIEAVRDSLSIWKCMIMILICLNIMIPVLIESESSAKQNRSIREIERLKYRIHTQYEDDYEQLCIFLAKINLNQTNSENENNDCFDLMYKLLFEMKQSMKSEIEELDDNMRNIEEYEKLQRLKICISKVESAMSKIKMIRKVTKINKKKEIFLKLRENIQQMDCVKILSQN